MPRTGAVACCLALIACAGSSEAAPASQPAPASHRPARPSFELRSGFWTNLHHALHYAATARRPPPPSAPAPPEDPAWTAAVEHYRARFGERGGMGIIFDEELVALTRTLSALDDDDPVSGVDEELATHLRGAAATVRERWPERDGINSRWITALEPLLQAHGEALRNDLLAAYGASWPEDPIRVEVSCFAGPVGAYTVERPALTTISSCDAGYAGPAALEMIFHEASHTMSAGLEARIDEEAARLGRPAPPNLWHAVLFYTAGELTRRRLGPEYVPYATANGLWGGPTGDLETVRREWQPYLDGERTFDAAVRALVRAAVPEPD